MATPDRRYKIGEHKVYDKAYDRKYKDSQVLNYADPKWKITPCLNDITALKALKMQIAGNEDRKYYYPQTNKFFDCQLKVAEDNIAAIKQRWEDFRQRRINEGFGVSEKMPVDIEHELFEAEAEQDIIKAELKRINIRLEAMEAEKSNERKRSVLRYGADGTAQLKNGIIVEIDGQVVKVDEEGCPRINDEHSPYNGLAVHVYRKKVVRVWLRENEKLQRRLTAEFAGKENKRPFNRKAKLPEMQPEWLDYDLSWTGE